MRRRIDGDAHGAVYSKSAQRASPSLALSLNLVLSPNIDGDARGAGVETTARGAVGQKWRRRRVGQWGSSGEDGAWGSTAVVAAVELSWGR